MKNNLNLGLLLACSLSFVLGCGQSSSTSVQTGDTFVGSDYFTPSANLSITGHIVGTQNDYNTDGSISETSTLDKDGNAYLGASVLRFGRTVFPLYSLDFNGGVSNDGRPAAYLGLSDGSVFGLNERAPNSATIFPKSLVIGQTYGPFEDNGFVPCHVTPKQHLASFTAKDGTSYSDVLQLDVTYADQSWEPNFTGGVDTTAISGSLAVYFAKGKGPVECDASWERREFGYASGKYYNRLRGNVSGYVTRKD